MFAFIAFKSVGEDNVRPILARVTSLIRLVVPLGPLIIKRVAAALYANMFKVIKRLFVAFVALCGVFGPRRVFAMIRWIFARAPTPVVVVEAQAELVKAEEDDAIADDEMGGEIVSQANHTMALGDDGVVRRVRAKRLCRGQMLLVRKAQAHFGLKRLNPRDKALAQDQIHTYLTREMERMQWAIKDRAVAPILVRLVLLPNREDVLARQLEYSEFAEQAEYTYTQAGLRYPNIKAIYQKLKFWV